MLESCTQLTFQAAGAPLRSKSEFVPLQISEFSERTRAHIKIQDGCNHACSFCKVVLVRGKSRSRPLTEIVEEAKRLVDHGYLEIVLTGIQLGAYGLDFETPTTLIHVLEALHGIEGIQRIRLSSIEPNDVTDSLIETMREIPEVCHHLHIPLQSGSNSILKAMNRRYRKEQYLELVQKLNETLDDFILTTDVMAGFPSETDRDFEETVKALLETRPFKLHIFPYSAREGTRAHSFKSVPTEIVKQRMDVLFELEEKLKQELKRRYLGRELDILMEDHGDTQWLHGRASNYLPVRIPASLSSAFYKNKLIPVKVERLESNFLVGQVLNPLTKRSVP